MPYGLRFSSFFLGYAIRESAMGGYLSLALAAQAKESRQKPPIQYDGSGRRWPTVRVRCHANSSHVVGWPRWFPMHSAPRRLGALEKPRGIGETSGQRVMR